MGPEFEWTPEQALAIVATEHTLLAAGAGTGKTTTVVGKILWHLGLPVGRVRGRPLPPCPEPCRLDQVVAVTFTEKAAYDLKRKLREELGRASDGPRRLRELERAAIGTIHAFCADLIREHALRLGVDPGFRVMDEREAALELDAVARRAILEALERDDEGVVAFVANRGFEGAGEHGRGALEAVLEAVRDLRWHGDRYARWTRDGRLDREALRRASPVGWDARDDASLEELAVVLRLAHAALQRWAEFLERENLRDFDALVLDARRLLLDPAGAAALDAVRRRYRLFVIDEFQDTDAAQRDIAFAVAGIPTRGPADRRPHLPQLVLVGDPKQSIYRFRGADVAVWTEVAAAFGRDRVLDLTENFRSDPAVVDLVNAACPRAFDETAAALADRAVNPADPLRAAQAPYAALKPTRPAARVAGVEWVLASVSSAEERREREAELVAARIREMVAEGKAAVVDPDDPRSGREVPCRYGHVAVLFPSWRALPFLERALRRYDVPYYVAGAGGRRRQLEVLDLVTALRLVENPGDELRAFAFLRSPFVGLRDETIAWIRLSGDRGTPLLEGARAALAQDAWPAAPEDPRVPEIEREALSRALELLDDMHRLRSRLAPDALAQELLDRAGYRTHLLLLPQPEPALANLEVVLGLLAGYRDRTLGDVLQIWDRWDEEQLEWPQAPLYTREDDVVTLTTIHGAKGLEWPVVFVVDIQEERSPHFSGRVWSDRALGPVLCANKDDRGPRAQEVHARREAEECAERARLLYVALTRARDRLCIALPGPDAEKRVKGMAAWVGAARAATGHTVTAPPVPPPTEPPGPALEWLAAIEPAPAGPLVEPVAPPRARYLHSATELLVHRHSREEWRSRYLHGVEPVGVFAPEPGARGLPPRVRGDIVHDVLERIRGEDELAELLDEAIAALDAPEWAELLAPGGPERAALEEEIAAVLRSPEWRSYTDGPHWRELGFVHLVRPRHWRAGAFDLYRPEGVVVDFKTHDVDAAQARRVADLYGVQAAVYRRAVAAIARQPEARAVFHFTRPNLAVGVG